ncbi:MAG: SOS response-associated peptidase [Candidatus Saccharimonadales bacterium]
MIQRYALYEIEKIRDRFQLATGLPKGVKIHYNIRPTQTAPVIVSRDGKPTVELMKWGFIPPRAKDTNSVFRYKTYETRVEKVFDQTASKDVIRTRRCLVPANGFYQWRDSASGKLPFFIRPSDQDIFAFGGIYSSWTDPLNVTWGMYSIVTMPSNAEMATISDRMPLLLHPADEANWLNPEVYDGNTLYDIMRPYPDGNLVIHPVGPDINSTKIDKPHLITRFTAK